MAVYHVDRRKNKEDSFGLRGGRHGARTKVQDKQIGQLSSTFAFFCVTLRAGLVFSSSMLPGLKKTLKLLI